MSKIWDCQLQGASRGLYPEEDLPQLIQEGKLTRDTLVKLPEGRDWKKAENTELSNLFPANAAAPGQPAEVSIKRGSEETERQREAAYKSDDAIFWWNLTEEGKKMRLKYVKQTAIVGFLVLIMVAIRILLRL